LLDVGCGAGKWLFAAIKRGTYPVGVDLSQKAIAICKKTLPWGGVCLGAAEALPFHDKQFHVVSCLGSLEHFLDSESALEEIVRVARDDAIFLLLVPNTDFLTRRLGLYGGTDQSAVREQVRTLTQWQELFEASGLKVIQRWRDLHVLSWSWIANEKWYHIPVRAVQAIALLFWPLSWQYQVYHLCKKHKT
jgi:ubiquinone/menaquinone biosynthesis C-methylase UbiE